VADKRPLPHHRALRIWMKKEFEFHKFDNISDHKR
jgi:hypothetical protein